MDEMLLYFKFISTDGIYENLGVLGVNMSSHGLQIELSRRNYQTEELESVRAENSGQIDQYAW
jgi:hypothetical protein